MVACIPLASALIVIQLAAVPRVLAEQRDAEVVSPELLEGEHQRLAEEMAQLASRQIWSGLERKFLELEAIGVELDFQDLLFGAYAARGVGDVEAARSRLERAAKLQTSKEVGDWLRNIASSYGQVVLSVPKARDAELAPRVMPFAPDQRAAVDHAISDVAHDGRFEGLLPRGDYTLCDVPFIVEPGITLQLEVSSRQRRAARRQADADQEAEPGQADEP